MKILKKVWTKLLITLEIYRIKFYAKTDNKGYLLWDCLVDNNVECIDAYTLFLYLKSINKKAYYVLLENNVLYSKLKAENNLDGVLVIKNSIITHPIEFLKIVSKSLKNTKYIITSFAENHKTIKKFFKKEKRFKYIFLQHGVTYLKESVFLKKYIKPKEFDKYLVSSEKERFLFKKYGFEDNQLIVSSLPRWDNLTSDKTNNKNILVMFTWRNFTTKSTENSIYYQKICEFLNDSGLIELLREKDIKIYFAPHHRIYEEFKNSQNLSPNINFIQQEKISKFIKNSSLFITDFSSVVFDFMFQNKPIILYGLDKNDAQLSFMDNFDLENLHNKQKEIPNIVFDKKDVIDKIAFYDQNNFEIEPETKILYDKFISVRKNICSHLTEQIENI